MRDREAVDYVWPHHGHQVRAKLSWLSQGAPQKCARAHMCAERSTANPEIQPARNSVRTPEGRTPLPASFRRGLLGFAGLASHSGRSSVPFRLTLFRDRRYFPSNPSTATRSTL